MFQCIRRHPDDEDEDGDGDDGGVFGWTGLQMRIAKLKGNNCIVHLL